MPPITDRMTALGYDFRPAERLAILGMLAPDRPAGGIRAALLEGPPGAGKTYLPQVLAQALGCDLVFGLLHTWSDDQELFCGVDVAAAVAGEASAVRQPGLLAVAAEKSQTGTVVLCLDEVDKVQERTEYLLLDFLQTGRVPVRPGHHILAYPENLLVFLTSNGVRELSDPLLRRVRRVRLAPMKAERMEDLAIRATGVNAGLVRMLRKAGQQIAQEDGAIFTLQELIFLSLDVWRLAQAHGDVREFLSQWAARGNPGRAMAQTFPSEAIWAQVVASRRQAPVSFSGVPIPEKTYAK